MKRWLWILAAGCFTAAHAQNGKSVTLELPAQTVEQVVAALSAQAEKPLKVDNSLKSEILAIYCQGQSAEDVMDEIARVLFAEWIEEKGGLKLIPKPSLERAAAEEEVAGRSKIIGSRIDATLKRQRENAVSDEDLVKQLSELMSNMDGARGPQTATKWRSAMEALPGAQVGYNLLKSIPTLDLARMAPGERKVFSLAPTLMQRPLATSALSTARSFVEKQRKFQEAFDKEMNSGAGGARMVMGPSGMLGRPVPPGDVASVIVIVTRTAGMENYVASVTVANAKNEVLAQGGAFIGPDDTNQPEPAFSLASESQFTVSAISREMLTALNSARPPGNGIMFRAAAGGRMGRTIVGGGASAVKPKLSEELRNLVLNPHKTDFLSLYPSDVVRELGKELKKPIVAVLPDDTLTRLRPVLGTDKPKMDAIVRAMQLDAGLTIREKDGWVQVLSRNPLYARNTRISRGGLSGFLGVIDKSTLPTLDMRADYAATRPFVSAIDAVDALLASMINPGAVTFDFPGMDGEQSDMLRLYGRLSKSQRDQLRNGGTLNVGNLDNRQTEALNAIIFASQDGPGKPGPESGPGAGMPRGGFMQGTSPSEERTSVFANGVPKSTLLKSKVEYEDMMMAKRASGAETVVSPEAYAWSSYGPSFGGGGAADTYAGFRAAKALVLNLTIDLGGGFTMDRQVSDYTWSSGDPYTSVDNLPAILKKRIEEARVQAMDATQRIGDLPRRGSRSAP